MPSSSAIRSSTIPKGPGQTPKAGEGDVLSTYGLEAHRPGGVLNDSILKEIG
jgi:hypothetical protein